VSPIIQCGAAMRCGPGCGHALDSGKLARDSAERARGKADDESTRSNGIGCKKEDDKDMNSRARRGRSDDEGDSADALDRKMPTRSPSGREDTPSPVVVVVGGEA